MEMRHQLRVAFENEKIIITTLMELRRGVMQIHFQEKYIIICIPSQTYRIVSLQYYAHIILESKRRLCNIQIIIKLIIYK